MSLEMRGIAKFYAQGRSRLEILSNLELTTRPGEILAVVGASGTGKSTLLALIGGFESPDQGTLTWDGQDTCAWKDFEWSRFRRENLGFVFQNYHLIPYLTAIENVALPLRLLGRKNGDMAAEELLGRLGLLDRAHHLPSQLSGGERQRVAIARALIHQPALVLADEPTGSLDVNTGTQVLDVLFGELRARQQTALVVTHASEVAARCDRVLNLRSGKLC